MNDLHLRLTDSGKWVTNWMGHDHLVAMNPQDDLEFVSMGLTDLPPVRIETTPHGVISSVLDNRTGEPINEIRIPKKHFLYREVVIGKPFKD